MNWVTVEEHQFYPKILNHLECNYLGHVWIGLFFSLCKKNKNHTINYLDLNNNTYIDE